MVALIAAAPCRRLLWQPCALRRRHCGHAGGTWRGPALPGVGIGGGRVQAPRLKVPAGETARHEVALRHGDAWPTGALLPMAPHGVPCLPTLRMPSRASRLSHSSPRATFACLPTRWPLRMPLTRWRSPPDLRASARGLRAQVQRFFASVVKNVTVDNMELKKLVCPNAKDSA